MVKPLDFSERAEYLKTVVRARMTRQQWFLVFGAERVDNFSAKDLASSITNLYADIESADIDSIIESYIEQKNDLRNETNV